MKMEATIDQSKKNYVDAFYALKEVYNSYSANQPLEPNDKSGRLGRILHQEIKTTGYPIASVPFLESLRKEVAVIIMPAPPNSTNYEPKEHCIIIPPLEVDKFCKEHGLEITLKAYINVASHVFKDASEITLSLSKDPEIENYVKVCFNIRIKTDIQSMLQMDKEFFKAIESVVSDNKKYFFVKTYELIE